jgi:uncharacterized membrane protein YidH (DUF202 family)
MGARRILGLVLIAIGLIALLAGGISWTQRKTVVDAGPLQVQADEHKTLPLPPVLGGIAVVAGALLLLVPARTRG